MANIESSTHPKAQGKMCAGCVTGAWVGGASGYKTAQYLVTHMTLSFAPELKIETFCVTLFPSRQQLNLLSPPTAAPAHSTTPRAAAKRC